jgi:hypothetical protein
MHVLLLVVRYALFYILCFLAGVGLFVGWMWLAEKQKREPICDEQQGLPEDAVIDHKC